jgi:hypothetical protein
MRVDRCDFHVPPAATGWYGIMSREANGDVWLQAAFWNGSDWAEYPVRAYSRSMATFPTKAAALDWAFWQPD